MAGAIRLLPLISGHGNAHRRSTRIVGYAIVRDDSYARDVLQPLSWYLDSTGYARTTIKSVDGKRRHVYLHRLVFEHYHRRVPAGEQVDHKNRDKLDRTPENLRPVSRSVQIHNQSPRRDNMSGHRGVSYDRRKCRWHARIMVRGKPIHLGYFDSFGAAAAARRAAEVTHYGECFSAA
jgi:hypothetical protein